MDNLLIPVHILRGNGGVNMEQKKHQSVDLPHHLALHERKTLSLEGITDVGHFDETSLIVETSLGELTICGQNLHVSSLNLRDGLLSVFGRIDSLSYHESRKRGGFLRSLLR